MEPGNIARKLLWEILCMQQFLERKELPTAWLNLHAIEADLRSLGSRIRVQIEIIRQTDVEEADRHAEWLDQHTKEVEEALQRRKS